MAPLVDTDDLIDSQEVAEILGLSHRNSVSTYLRRYEDFPRPVVERGGGRTKLWLRGEVLRWDASRRG
jgi:glutathione-regulated potassium-efflux system ancillary protein KefG